MPNHVENRIEFSGDEKQIHEMLEAIKSDKYGLGTIDFNKIIPMPESLNIEAGSATDRGLKIYREFIEIYNLGFTAESALKRLENIPPESEAVFLKTRADVGYAVDPKEWEFGKTAWNNIQKYGAPTWYEWCINNWGTKWNAYGYDEYTDYSGCDDFGFQTANDAPHSILQKLSEMYPGITFEHQWADEDIGCNCGKRVYSGGEVIDEFFPEGIRATEFALEVWDYDPADLNLVKNSTGTAYISTDCEKYQLIELFGRPALFSDDRITPNDIPEGLYCYDLRHGDDGRFCTVEPKVSVNYNGSVICDEPIDFGKEGYISFTEDTEPNFIGTDLTFGEYMCGEFEPGETESQQMGGMQL